MATVANFIDTNILIHALSEDGRSAEAQALLAQPFAISVQALNEFANVAHRKLRMPWPDIAEAINAIIEAATIIAPIDEGTTLSALELVQRHNFSFYDASMVSAALRLGCEQYHSEDLQHGLVIDKQLTIINPFRT